METAKFLHLLSNLSGMDSEKEILKVFCETLEREFPGLSVSFLTDNSRCSADEVLPLRTNKENFGFVSLSFREESSLGDLKRSLKDGVTVLGLILENVRQREKLSDSARLYKRDMDDHDLFLNSLMNTLPMAVYTFDIRRMKFTNINEKFLLYSGYTPSELIQMEESFLDLLVYEKDRDKLKARYCDPDADLLNEDSEYRIVCRDGSVHWIRCRERVYRSDENNVPSVLIGTAFEVTDIKDREEERKYILETACCVNDMNSLYNLHTSLNEVLGFLCIRLRYIMDVLSVSCIPVGFSTEVKADFDAVSSFALNSSSEFMNYWKNIFSVDNSFIGKKITQIEYKIRHCSSEQEKYSFFSCLKKKGTGDSSAGDSDLHLLYDKMEIYLLPLYYDGHVIGYYVVFSESRLESRMIDHLGLIADKINSLIEKHERSKELERSLEEKNILLQEIHHRVKNNMQIISSLLKLQSSNQDDSRYDRLIDMSRKRIAAMALVHEKLYQSDDFSRIEFGEYMRSLVGEITRAEEGSLPIEVILRSDKFLLVIEKIVPCGLIINELMTNSVKHAFADIENPVITIDVSSLDEYVSIFYKDNGRGRVDNDTCGKGLGLELVNSLVFQLRGEIHENFDEGLSYTITIPN